MNLKEYIADVPDFPKKGIIFRDITPLMQDGKAFHQSVDELVEFSKTLGGADVVVGPEARGFIFGCPLAYELNIGFVPIRKPGKLPRETVDVNYDLEYGSNTLSMHVDGVKAGDRVIICDDLLATGGTVKATIDIIEKLGGIVVGCCFLIELEGLKGRDLLKGYKIETVMKY